MRKRTKILIVVIIVVAIASVLVLFAFPIVDTNSPYSFATKWGSRGGGAGDGQFNNPRDIAFDYENNVYVVDSYNARIQMFQLVNPCYQGSTQIVPGVCFVTTWGSRGSGDGQFSRPMGVAPNKYNYNTDVYVADSGHNEIQKFQSVFGNRCQSGTTQIVPGICFVTTWGSRGTGDGQFFESGNVALDRDDNITVADSGNHRIQMFQLVNPCPSVTTQIVPGVCFVTTWGSRGTGDGQFNTPSDVAFDSSNNLYVVDLGNDRIQKFQLVNPCQSGTTQIVPGVCFVTTWGSRGSGDGQFNTPSDVAFDSSNNVYVVDSRNARIQKFQLVNPCPSGTTQIVPGVCFVTTWGSRGTEDGQFVAPYSVDLDSSNNVYVVDSWRNEIQKFVPPHRTIFDILMSRIH